MILVVLADSAEPDRTACVSLRALSTRSGAARSTVLRALNDLEERGLLSRRSQLDADGARLPSRFHLNCSTTQRFTGPAQEQAGLPVAAAAFIRGQPVPPAPRNAGGRLRRCCCRLPMRRHCRVSAVRLSIG